MPSLKSLSEWMRSHPVVMQLQFLPLIYARPNDSILVSELPDNPDPRLCLIDDPPKNLPIEHWGPSRAIAAWAQKHQIPYSIPDWNWVRTINSKVFSFTHSPKLPLAKLLNTQDEVEEWIKNTPDPKLLKTPFGTAGSGHIRNPKIGRAYPTPIIGEPWVERILDFSTQWQNGKLLGATAFENEPNGTYKGTFALDIEYWALEEHLAVARPLIEKLQYGGNIGVDAFIYLWEGKKRVHPVVEINARKTMSWAALQMPQKRLYYTPSAEGLLPSHLGKIQFKRNITCT